MREQYLHTDRYPAAIFTLERVRKASATELKPNTPIGLTVEGSFELHGVQRKIEVPVRVTYLPESSSTMGKLPGNLLRITSEFDVKLADYGIERPQMVLLKVGEVAHLSVDVFTTDANSQKLSMWMGQMKKMMGSE
jgi:polyisoprenoid-binding protein YceI